MGSDNLFLRHSSERRKRKENILKQKSNYWLIVCEGKKTEPNYFKSVIDYFNKDIEEKYKLKVKIVGMGMNTKSLVKATDLQINIDKYSYNIIPYGKIFVVFDKDDFLPKDFDEAISMCISNDYIPLWSNQAIEFWFLLHFYYIDGCINRNEYAYRINKCFNDKGFNYKYMKNDDRIFELLNMYGYLYNARKYAKKIYDNFGNIKPSMCESCTTLFKFFDEIDERLKELQ